MNASRRPISLNSVVPNNTLFVSILFIIILYNYLQKSSLLFIVSLGPIFRISLLCNSSKTYPHWLKSYFSVLESSHPLRLMWFSFLILHPNLFSYRIC